MKLETFFDNFELLADAPNGVQKLREMVLQLAVQGKLVPQDPKDEPASVLLEKIKAEKKGLIKEKKIRKGTPLPPIDTDSVPYELPMSWAWSRLGVIGRIVGGGTPKTGNSEYFSEKGIPWLTPADLYKLEGKYIARGRRDISALGLQKSSAQLMPKGTVLFSSRAPIGYVAIANNELCTNQGFKSCVPFIIDMNEYIYYFLKHAAKEIDNQASGTTFKEVSGKIVSEIMIPVPPLKEQKRIVAKIDELMALCDGLEASKQKVSINCIQLNDASIHKLLTAREPKKFRKHWQRICNNFDLLYSKPANVDKLRQAILQLTIQGKLVPQDPKDEPASVLLEKIKAEKERLIKEGKIKKGKPLPPIKSDEMPYELPNGWEWTRLVAIGLINPRNEIGDETEVSFVPMKLVPTVLGDRVGSEIRLWGDIKNGFTHFSEGDVALAKITPCFQNRKSAVMRGLKNGLGAGTTELHIFRPIINLIISEYILLYLKTSKFIREGVSKMTGSAGQKRVPKTYFSETPFPLPPTNEQKRIVAKVDELMSLCDELETSLSQSHTDCDRLMEAAVAEILAA